MPAISLVLPTYNESANIERVLDESIAALEAFGRPFEVLVIDNHSSDDTSAMVIAYIKRTAKPVRIIVHPENRLYSGSCATALSEAKGKYVAIMDSDGQYTASDIPRFVAELEQGSSLVFGWRRERRDPMFRRLVSWMFNLLSRFWLGSRLRDLNVGFRAYDRRFAAEARIEHRINMSNPELYARARMGDMRVSEVEIRHAERRAGVTSHDFKRSLTIFLAANGYMRALAHEIRRTPSPPHR